MGYIRKIAAAGLLTLLPAIGLAQEAFPQTGFQQKASYSRNLSRPLQERVEGIVERVKSCTTGFDIGNHMMYNVQKSPVEVQFMERIKPTSPDSQLTHLLRFIDQEGSGYEFRVSYFSDGRMEIKSSSAPLSSDPEVLLDQADHALDRLCDSSIS
jgi:hypothetical protein